MPKGISVGETAMPKACSRRSCVDGTLPFGMAVLPPPEIVCRCRAGVYGPGLPDPEFSNKATLYFGQSYNLIQKVPKPSAHSVACAVGFGSECMNLYAALSYGARMSSDMRVTIRHLIEPDSAATT